MKNYQLIIGVDVSKLKLDLVGIDIEANELLKHQIIENNKKTIKAYFTKIIKKFKKDETLITFENTGIYGKILAETLHLLNIDFCELSALEIKRSSGIKRGKSDKTDALTIAQHAITHKFKIKLTTPVDKPITAIKALYTQREKIVKAIKQFESNVENKEFTDNDIFKDLEKTNKSILKNLEKNLKLINTKIKGYINSREVIKNNYNLMQSIPGIGPQTATYLLIIAQNFTCFENVRKLACYAGVAPFPYSSGSSIRGRNKVSNLADKKLKSLLNMCALTVKKYDPEIKKYYTKKVEEGKNKMLVINNIRNKLLTRIFAVINRQKPYVIIGNHTT